MKFLWTEYNFITGFGISMASKCTCCIIVCIAVSIWTSLFEYCWIVVRPVATLASLWCSISTSATILISIEGQTSTLACNFPSIVPNCQLIWTNFIQVTVATSWITIKIWIWNFSECSRNWVDFDWKIVSVDKWYIIIILITPTVERKLSQRGWRVATCSIAFNFVSYLKIFVIFIEKIFKLLRITHHNLH